MTPEMPTAIVDIAGLTRAFAGGTVLDAVDLVLQPAEIVALLGRSGSGKSTLLRVLAGLDDAPARRLVLPRRRGVVFQEPRLLPWKTVLDNVALGLPAGNGRARAERMLDEVGLAHRREAWPLTLSGGEAQRASLARALVREPELLLLDEPFASLDALTRLQMHQLLAALWRRHRPAVLLVTHDVREAVALADRVLVLDGGRFVADVRVPLARRRRAADPAAVALEQDLLACLGVDTLVP